MNNVFNDFLMLANIQFVENVRNCSSVCAHVEKNFWVSS